uniref:CCHC-type domain-containing protein n=2 Tax=Gasterosteus aculeatus TaxID=69293 RepID=A0AAQ4RJS6_GASAC
MAMTPHEQPIPRVGLRYTLRFRATKEDDQVLSRVFFGKQVIMGQLHLMVQDVLCIQWNQQEKAFDVTLGSEDIYRRVSEICRKDAKVSPLAYYEVLNLDRPNFRTVSVHMYNPFVTDEALVSFLGRYGEVATAARHVKDPLGFWTGRRQFQVLLNPDPTGPDGLQHPPAFFSLGGDRGYLFYNRQPAFCRKCRRSGHSETGCTGESCRFCGQTGHAAKDCTVPRNCHGCGGSDHLYRSCPSRKRTFSEVTRQTGVSNRTLEQGKGSKTSQNSEEGPLQMGSGAETTEGEGKTALQEEGAVLEDEVARAADQGVMEEFPELTLGASFPTMKQGVRKLSEVFEEQAPEYEEGAEEERSKKNKRKKKDAVAKKEGIDGSRREEAVKPGKSTDEVQEGGTQEELQGPNGNVAVEGEEQCMGEGAVLTAERLGIDFDLPQGLLMLSPPYGVDIYDGPSRPVNSPNTVPLSWAEEMDKDTSYTQ